MVVFPGAKINVGLYVTEKRTDGYHNIETLFYPLGFSDVLEVVPDQKLPKGLAELSISGLNVEGPAGTNLVVRAYRLLHDRFALPGVRAYLHKCIPTGAGLGGGSSDGASMLLILNKLFDLNLSACELSGLALKLGSDCPYFLDPVPSFAHGRGEELTQAGWLLKGLHLFLFHPGTGLPTVSAYQHVEVAQPAVPVEELNRIPVTDWSTSVHNAFESFACRQLPLIKVIKDELYRSGALYASMTGSGSAVYGLFEQEIEIPARISEYLIWKQQL